MVPDKAGTVKQRGKGVVWEMNLDVQRRTRVTTPYKRSIMS